MVKKYETKFTFKSYVLRGPEKLITEKIASELWFAV